MIKLKNILTEQEGDNENYCETNKKALIDYLIENRFKLQDKAYIRKSGDKVLSVIIDEISIGEVRFYVSMDTEIKSEEDIPSPFDETSFATYSRWDDTPSFKSLGSYFGKKYTYQYEYEQTPSRTYCNSGLSGTKPFNDTILKRAINVLIKQLP